MRVNSQFAEREDLTTQELEEVNHLARVGLQSMNDRQFVNWLLTDYLAIGVDGQGTVLIGISTAPDSHGYRFKALDVGETIKAEINTRLASPRINDEMIIVHLPRNTAPHDPIKAVGLFLDAFLAHNKLGADEPALRNSSITGLTLSPAWVRWYSALNSVDENAAWKAGADRLAAQEGKSPDVWFWGPDEHNSLDVVFVRRPEARKA